MTWKDLWLPAANVIMFFVLFGSALALDDSTKATHRMTQALCWLGLGILLLVMKVLGHLGIIVPAF